MSLYFLDTDICSYILKRSHPNVFKKLQQLDPESLAISVISEAELLYGIKLSHKPRVDRAAVSGFISNIRVLDWTRAAAEHYADIRADLRKRGQPIGANDLMIAAHARSLNATIITNNVREFSKVKHLSVDNWV